jgi:hypothetical protein
MDPSMRFLIALGALIALASTFDWAYVWSRFRRAQDHTPPSPLYDRFRRRQQEMQAVPGMSREWRRHAQRTPDEAA